MPLPYNISTNVVYQDVKLAEIMITDVATGRRVMVMISSDTGFGKSHLLRKVLRKLRIAWEEAAPQDVTALVRVLWQMQNAVKNGMSIQIAVLDDVDSLARRETEANLMKSAFGDTRRVIFQSSAALKNDTRRDAGDHRYDPAIAPPEFPIFLRLVWLSNHNWTDPAALSNVPEHFRALVSKGLDPLWIRNDADHDGRDLFLYTHWSATEAGFLKAANANGAFPYDVARQAINFYVTHVHRLIDIPPRRLQQIANIIHCNTPGSERDRRLEAMLRSTDQRPKLRLPASWLPVLLWPEQPVPKPPKPSSEPPPPAPDPDLDAHTDARRPAALKMAEEAANENALRDPVDQTVADPPSASEPIPEPPVEPATEFTTDPDRPLQRGTLTPDQVAVIEERNDLKRFSGRTGDGVTLAVAREMRALYVVICIDHNITMPDAILKQTRKWWAEREGHSVRGINQSLERAQPIPASREAEDDPEDPP